jgi:3-hydroxyacyl-CoA dehydrogenase
MRTIQKAVVLGGNGAMGSGSGAVFAAAGIPTVLLARTLEKAEAGRARADQSAKGRIPPNLISCGTYAQHLAPALVDADLVLEAVSEDIAVKREVLAAIDRVRRSDAIVATVSSGLSIAEMCGGMSDGFRSHFLGVHLFNPPTSITGCELIAHTNTDPGVIAIVRDFLANVCGREVVECADQPAFAGNRVGFKVLNEVAQLAEEHGVAFIDQLVGPHTGRVLSPLATIDLVGWDVHKAIVDNLHRRTQDTAHAAFALPAYMQRGIDRGHLGRKTRDMGGFFRVDKTGGETKHYVLDAVTGEYRSLTEVARPAPSFVERMKIAIRTRRHDLAMEVLCTAEGLEADLLRKILLGYISYGLGLVGEVVARARDIDRIMAYGFQWAPPSVLVDAIGARRTVTMLERVGLPVPAPVLHAATHQRTLFNEPTVDCARFFTAAA